MLNCLACISHAKGGATALQEVIRSSLQIIFPGSADVVLKSFEEQGFLPKRSLLQRYHIVLDITLLLMARGQDMLPVSRYLWTDASPSKGNEWLWMQCILVCDRQTLETYEALLRLTVALKAHALQHGSQEPLETEVMEIMAYLHSQVKRRVYVPVALAASHTSLSHKARGIVHMMCMETRSWSTLRSHLSSIISITTDLGTEVGLAQYSCKLREVAPAWFNTSGSTETRERMHELELEGEGFAPPLPADHHAEAAVAAAELVAQEVEGVDVVGLLCPQAFQVPGVQHIIDNMNTDVHCSLSYWDTF